MGSGFVFALMLLAVVLVAVSTFQYNLPRSMLLLEDETKPDERRSLISGAEYVFECAHEPIHPHARLPMHGPSPTYPNYSDAGLS